MQGLKKSAIVEDPVVPLQWQEVGQVDQLYVYPVKSFSPVAVPSISTGENAARAKDMVDRQFIVLDRSHHHHHHHRHRHHPNSYHDHQNDHHHHQHHEERESRQQDDDGLT